MKKKTKRNGKPLTISVHGSGVDIDMKIDDVTGLDGVFEAIAQQMGRAGAPHLHVPASFGGASDVPHGSFAEAFACALKSFDDARFDAVKVAVEAEYQAREMRRS